jgi:hypothetical protein
MQRSLDHFFFLHGQAFEKNRAGSLARHYGAAQKPTCIGRESALHRGL